MPRDIQFDIAEFVSAQGYTGVATVVLPHWLAQRLVDGYQAINSDIQSAADVSKMESTRSDGLEVTYDLGSVPANQVIIRQDGTDSVLMLPSRLRFV